MNNIIRISDIVHESIVDGTGIRYVIFTQGCLHNCDGCHNPDTHDLNAGTQVNIDEVVAAVSADPLLDGVTFSGGEPFLQANALVALSREIKRLGKNIWAYSGYTFEQLMDDEEKTRLLKNIDVLVDGLYVQELRDLTLKFRGSSNQRVIDCVKSLEQNKIVLYYI